MVGSPPRCTHKYRAHLPKKCLRAPRCCLVVLAIEVAKRWSARGHPVRATPLPLPNTVRTFPPGMPAAPHRECSDGLDFLPAAARSFSASLLSLFRFMAPATSMARPLTSSDVLVEHRLDSPPHPRSQLCCARILQCEQGPDRIFFMLLQKGVWGKKLCEYGTERLHAAGLRQLP